MNPAQQQIKCELLYRPVQKQPCSFQHIASCPSDLHPRGISIRSCSSPSSTWSLAVSECRCFPTRRSSTLSSSDAPPGVSGDTTLGTSHCSRVTSSCTPASFASTSSSFVQLFHLSSQSFGLFTVPGLHQFSDIR